MLGVNAPIGMIGLGGIVLGGIARTPSKPMTMGLGGITGFGGITSATNEKLMSLVKHASERIGGEPPDVTVPPIGAVTGTPGPHTRYEDSLKGIRNANPPVSVLPETAHASGGLNVTE